MSCQAFLFLLIDKQTEAHSVTVWINSETLLIVISTLFSSTFLGSFTADFFFFCRYRTHLEAAIPILLYLFPLGHVPPPSSPPGHATLHSALIAVWKIPSRDMVGLSMPMTQNCRKRELKGLDSAQILFRLAGREAWRTDSLFLLCNHWNLYIAVIAAFHLPHGLVRW